MKLTKLIGGIEVREGDDANDGGQTWTCTPCGQWVHGRWGHCSKCHTTFASLRDFDRHRTGDYATKRRCLTAEELAGRGWTVHEHGVTRPPVKDKSDEAAS